jgi:hypothetical protein
MMKKYSWIAALVLALSLAFMGCPDGGGKKGGGGQQGGGDDDVWTVVWVMSEDDGIQALTAGDTLSFAAGANPFDPLVRAGGDNDVTIKAVATPDDTIGIEYTTVATWGAGIDLANSVFGFKEGDKITITGELLSAGAAQVNFKVGSEDSHGYNIKAEGPIEWEIELTAAYLAEIRGGSPAGLRIDGRPGAVTVRIDEIRIEGMRPSTIKKLAAPVISLSASGVQWAAVDGAQGYNVYADGDYDNELATLAAGATSINLNAMDDLVVDQDYEITVVALGLAGTSKDSDPSNTVTYTHQLPEQIYQAPAAGADFFYLNLNEYTKAGTASINATVPEGELEADKITLSFTENSQRVNFKLDAAQVALLSSAIAVSVTIDGTATPDTLFRYHFGDPEAGSSWNATDTFSDGAFSTVLTKALTFSGNKSDTTLGYFILQQRAVADTEVVINSIKITYTAPGTYVPVTGITGVPTTGSVGTTPLTGIVSPSYATNKTIVWTVKDAGTTGATISGSTLTTTAEGTVEVTATIANGLTDSTPYTQDFEIEILALTSFGITITGATGATTEVSYEDDFITGINTTIAPVVNGYQVTGSYGNNYALAGFAIDLGDKTLADFTAITLTLEMVSGDDYGYKKVHVLAAAAEDGLPTAGGFTAASYIVTRDSRAANPEADPPIAADPAGQYSNQTESQGTTAPKSMTIYLDKTLLTSNDVWTSNELEIAIWANMPTSTFKVTNIVFVP